MNLLVFGRNGQVAKELARLASEARFLDRAAADLSDPDACVRAILDIRPDAVINAAAWTAVDAAEENEAQATTINGEAPGAMARACKDLGIPFVQISTDYVFNGVGKAPFAPDHPTAPLNAYGRSKLRGEELVRASGATHAILRTSWVFSAHGHNFLKTMLRLTAERDRLTIVADQIGGPTPADAIAQACLTIATQLRDHPGLSGTYHLTGIPDTSWADFARHIARAAGHACVIEDIPTSAYPTPARRPANSRLDCSALAVFGLSRPDWRAAVNAIIAESEVSP